MIKKVITSIRHISHHCTGFDSYYSDLQNHSVSGSPSFDEARKDFRSSIHSQTVGYTG